MEPFIFILQHRILILSNILSLSNPKTQMFYLTSCFGWPDLCSQFLQPTFSVRRRTCLDQTIFNHFQSRWSFSPNYQMSPNAFSILTSAIRMYAILIVLSWQRRKKMGQNLLLNLNRFNISIKTQQHISQTWYISNRKTCYKWKVQGRKNSAWNFYLYCDRCQFYSALFLQKKRDCLL